jgi:hypothetical protein
VGSGNPIGKIYVKPQLDSESHFELHPVEGTSLNWKTDEKLGLFVLVHPEGDNSWFIQEDPIAFKANSVWSTKAWVGNKTISPKLGDKFDLAAIIAERSTINGLSEKKVSNPSGLSPKAQAIKEGLTIDRIIEVRKGQ